MPRIKCILATSGRKSCRDLPQPWFEKLIEGATAQGRFGDLVDQSEVLCFACRRRSIRFDLLRRKVVSSPCRETFDRPRAARFKPLSEIQQALRQGRARRFIQGSQLVGAFESAHEEDASLAAEVLLENLSGKVSAAHALRLVLAQLALKPDDIDFVISCSEEAVGDRYNRGGGNLAKAIAEDVGCGNASGCDVKAFCAGPMYAMVHGASLIQSGVAKKVAVVAGGSLAKLGMKFESHLKKNMPVSKTARQLRSDLIASKAWASLYAPRFRRVSSGRRRRFAQAMAE